MDRISEIFGQNQQRLAKTKRSTRLLWPGSISFSFWKGSAMHVVSVINYKGGVGKTSVTANLAAELAWRGLNVLLLDLDPQASLTFSFIRPEHWTEHFADSQTIKSWFD